VSLVYFSDALRDLLPYFAADAIREIHNYTDGVDRFYG
jgi:hypothetical protein